MYIKLYLIQPCEGNVSSRMLCPAPSLTVANESTVLYVGLLMDAACSLLILDGHTITVIKDPYFMPFQKPVVFQETDALESNLNVHIEVFKCYIRINDFNYSCYSSQNYVLTVNKSLLVLFLHFPCISFTCYY